MKFTYIGDQSNKEIRIAGSYANSAFLTGNSAFDKANSAYDQANSSAIYANGSFAHANAAFNAANTGATDTYARNTANAAFDAANSAINGSGGSLTVYVDNFTANGSTTTFTLNTAPTSTNYTTVSVDGILQHKDTYTLSSNVITFNSTFESGANIEVSSAVTGPANFTNRTFNGDGTTNTFTISANTSANSIIVSSNGSILIPVTDYTVSGTTLTFVVAPTNGTNIQVRELSPVVVGTITTSGGTTDNTIANAAFLKANSAYESQNTTGTYANTAINNAAGASLYANGSFIQANASYNQANTATNDASGASLYANSAFNYANSGYTQANTATTNAATADSKAVSAGSYANSAFTTANNALPKTGGIITGSLTVSSDLVVQGNLSILGNSTIITTSQLDIGDSLIYLANNNTINDAVDIGIIGHYNDTGNAHTGIIRDPNLKEWIFFTGYTPEVESNNLINIAHPSFSYANVYASVFKGNVNATTVFAGGYNLFTYTTNAYTQANTATSDAAGASLYANGAFIAANAAYNSQNTTGSYANSSYTQANTAVNNAAGASLYANAAFAQANAAFAVANTGGGGSTDTYARDTANAAFIQANAAYAQANTGGGGGVTTGKAIAMAIVFGI